MISVRIFLFGWVRESLNDSSLMLDLPENSRVGDLRNFFSVRIPSLVEPGLLRIAVNHEYVGDEYGLKSGDEVAIIPPVSGG